MASKKTAAFPGFDPKTIAFLRGLTKHNDKSWFDAHRADYDTHYIDAAKAFVEACGGALRKIAPEVRAEPKVNGSIFRINRDVRFSADKRPYKDHLDLWFWEGPVRKEAATGFFFRLKADYVAVGVGAHGFDKPRLNAYRDLVVDGSAGKSLKAAVRKVEKAGYEVEGSHYKKLPRGYEASDELEERLLRHNALFVGHEEKGPPKFVSTPELVGWCADHWKKLHPLHRWLVDHLQK